MDLETLEQAGQRRPDGLDALGVRDTTIFSIVTVDDGLITRMDEYLDREEALEAAGLRE